MGGTSKQVMLEPRTHASHHSKHLVLHYGVDNSISALNLSGLGVFKPFVVNFSSGMRKPKV